MGLRGRGRLVWIYKTHPGRFFIGLADGIGGDMLGVIGGGECLSTRVGRTKRANEAAGALLVQEQPGKLTDARRTTLIESLAAGYEPAQVAQAMGIDLGVIYGVCSDAEVAGKLAAAAAGMVAASLPAAVAKTIEMLGDPSPWVRMGAARQLLDLARGQQEERDASPVVQWESMPKPGMPEE